MRRTWGGDHRVPQTLQIRNGYRCPVNLKVENPQKSVKYTDLLSEDKFLDPSYMYPVLQRPKTVALQPQFVKYDKQCLVFFAFFHETVALYPEDVNRQRQVRVLYFLEDDTMSVLEGNEKVIRRKQHLKGSDSNYHWKDLNIGQEIKLNGIRFFLFDCDAFTRKFLESKGIELEVEDVSKHLQGMAPLTVVNKSHEEEVDLPNKGDKLKRFLESRGQVLSFDCQMENKDTFQKESLTFKLFFNLDDHTITIKELKENQEGRHKFPFYLRRTKVPREGNRGTFLTEKDLRVGEIIDVFGTKFLITDCDQFTREHFSRLLRNPQPPKMVTNPPPLIEKTSRQTIPTYLGLGTPEDSLAPITFRTKPKVKIQSFSDEDTVLRYTCCLEDEKDNSGLERKFILKFNLKYGTMTIVELPIDNSGLIQGRFITSQRVRKPNTNPDMPEFYGPSDLVVDRVIIVNCRRFRITGADKSVLEYMQRFPERFGDKGIFQD